MSLYIPPASLFFLHNSKKKKIGNGAEMAIPHNLYTPKSNQHLRTPKKILIHLNWYFIFSIDLEPNESHFVQNQSENHY